MEGDWIMSTSWTGLEWYTSLSDAQGGATGSSIGSAKVNEEIYARINFFDGDVKKVYLDWDDGVDQTPENGIYQWLSLDNPTNYAILSHTYTATGTFAPILRSVNREGFISKFYGSSSTNVDVNPYEQVKRISPMRVTDKTPVAINKIENKSVASGIDNSPFDDNPKDIFLGIPPLCTTAQFTNIQSQSLPQLELTVIRSVVSGTALTDKNSGGYKEVGKITVNVNLSGGTVSSTSDSGLLSPDTPYNRQINPYNEKIHKILKIKYMNPKVSGASYDTQVGLSKLKMFIMASGTLGLTFGNSENSGGSYIKNNLFFPITYVTAGDPIKEANDPSRTVNLDWSQSRSAASNVKTEKYLYDTGKAPYQLNNEWGASGTTYPDNYAVSSSNFNTGLSGNTDIYDTQYTYMTRPDGLMCGFKDNYLGDTAWSAAFYSLCTDVNSDLFNHSEGNNDSPWSKDAAIYDYDVNGGSAGYTSYMPVGDQFLVDDYDRFVDLYHLTRVQTKVQSGERSKLEHFDTYRVTPSRWLYSGNIYDGVATEMTDGQSSGLSGVVTSGAFMNSLSQVYPMKQPTWTLSSSAGILQDWITGDNQAGAYRIGPNTLQDNSEYLLLLLDRPFNKLYFNVSPFVSGGNASGNTDLDSDLIDRLSNPVTVQASYLKLTNSGSFFQKAEMVPLQIKDTTKYQRTVRDVTNDTYTTRTSSLAKSGYISFDTPSDWSKSSFSELVGNTDAPFDVAGEQKAPSYAIDWTGTCIRIIGPQGTATSTDEVAYGALLSGSGVARTSQLLNVSSSNIPPNEFVFTRNQDGGNFAWIASGTKGRGWYPDGNQYGIDSTHAGSSLPQGIMYVRQGKLGSGFASGAIWEGTVIPVNIYDAVPGFLKFDVNDNGNIGNAGTNYRFMFDNSAVGSGSLIGRSIGKRWKDKYLLQLRINGGNNRFPSSSGSRDANTVYGAELHNLLPADNAYSQIVKQYDNSAYNLSHLAITSDVGMARAGNYYKAMSKGGKAVIVRTGEPITSITLSGKGMGDEVEFRYNRPNTMYGDLHTLRNLQRDNVRVYWDEKQKDGTFVRFIGIITTVSETHSVQGPRAPRSYSATLVIEQVCLLNASGFLISDIQSLGGIKDEREYV